MDYNEERSIHKCVLSNMLANEKRRLARATSSREIASRTVLVAQIKRELDHEINRDVPAWILAESANLSLDDLAAELAEFAPSD